jgi:cell shape-determining protein MreD
MQGLKSSTVIIAIAFVVLSIQSAFAPILAPYPFSPYLGLPLVYALGTAPGVRLVRGAATSFALGYLYDLFTGNPLGIHTFAFVVAYLASWLVGYLMSFRGVVFEMGLSFGLTILVGGLIEIIRSFAPGGMAWSGSALTIALLASAFATALLSPLLFAFVRWVDPQSARVQT